MVVVVMVVVMVVVLLLLAVRGLACCSICMVTPKYFSNPPPIASAISPKHDRIGGFTSRESDGFCKLRKSSPTSSSQYGATLDSRARHMSPTTPTAIAHT